MKSTVDGIDVLRTSVEKLSSHISYIYQNPEEMFIQDTIENDITYFGDVRNFEQDELYDHIADSLNMKHLLPHDGRLLSGGQQRRSSVAIGLAMLPTVMMLDEPTASLDIGNRKQLIDILHSIRDRVKTVLIATHDMQLVAEWATRVIVMEHGKIIFDGTPKILFERVEVWKNAGLKLPQIAELSLALNIDAALSVDEFVERVKEVRIEWSLAAKIKDVLNVETIKLELIKTAFGKPDVYFAKIDARVLIFWYLTISILPWFTFNNTILITIILYTAFLAVISRVSPLILTLLAIGVVTELITIFIVSAFFGGGSLDAVLPILTLSMKIFIMSIASVSVFASMSPEKLSDGLLSLGLPAQFSFAVSYAYRMLPILLDEFIQIFQSFRLRGKTPENHGFLKWRIITII